MGLILVEHMARVYAIEEDAREVPTLKRGVTYINSSLNEEKEKFKRDMKKAYQIEVLRGIYL